MRLHQDEIGNRDVMVGVDVARQGGQRAVWHSNGHCRHVLEGIRHRE